MRIKIGQQLFDQITSGEITEAYRPLTEYHAIRIIKNYSYITRYGGEPIFKEIPSISFELGWTKSKTKMVVEVLNIEIGLPKREWSKDPNRCFIFKLGKIIKK